MGLAVWMTSPAPILRVAKTPRPASSVNPTLTGGGDDDDEEEEDGRFSCESWSVLPVVGVVVAKEDEGRRNGG